MANSVLAALDSRDEGNEIRLVISGNCSINKFTVLVEGIDDIKVYEKFFSKEKVNVYQTNGCAKLVELVEKLDSLNLEDKFIGIKDADYDVLNHVTYPYPNLFLTDKHDLETMMISEEALESIMKEYLRYEDMKNDRNDVDVHAFLQDAIGKLRSLSYCRWYNDVYGSNWSFGTLKLSTMIHKDPALSYDCCLSFIKRLNPDASTIPTLSMLTDFEDAHSEHIDVFHLLRGHDLCDMINLLLKDHPYSYKKTKVSLDKIEAAFRLAYSGEIFRQTYLYSAITSWFDSHGYRGMMAC